MTQFNLRVFRSYVAPFVHVLLILAIIFASASLHQAQLFEMNGQDDLAAELLAVPGRRVLVARRPVENFLAIFV